MNEKALVETRVHYLLRFFRDGKGDIYASSSDWRGGARRSWHQAETREARKKTSYRPAEPARDGRRDAYQFQSRGDARQVLRSPVFKDLLKPRSSYGRCEAQPDRSYFWEIIKVTATIVTTSEEEIVISDAPPMLTIARSATL
jgi:hypothetical protein